ncbi:MAG: alpha/beta fold hydrolase [Gemmatimonadales bacterium]
MSRTSFTLGGADGAPLRGTVRSAAGGAGRPAVVICHGFKGFMDWGFFPHVAERLARAGMTAVTFNFSGSGIGPDGGSFSEPERFRRATISNDLSDVAAVVERLRAGTLVPALAPPSAIGLFGHSRGGGTALLHAAGDPGVGTLVTWAAVGTFVRWTDEAVERWRQSGSIDIVNSRTGEVLPLDVAYLEDLEARSKAVSLARAAARIEVPWLIVHGEADESVPVEEGRAHLAAAGANATLELIAGAGHTFGVTHPWAGPSPEWEQAMDCTLDWFSRYLLA